MEKIGARVKRLRLDQDMRPEVLAVAADVSLQTIYKLERGGSVKAERIPHLARILGVSTDYLLGVTNDPTPCKGHRKNDEEISESEMMPAGLETVGV